MAAGRSTPGGKGGRGGGRSPSVGGRGGRRSADGAGASISGGLVDDLKFKTAKTKAGRRILENRGAKIVENEKKLMLIRGRKVSEVVKGVFVELARMKGSEVVKLQRNNDFTPFESGGEEPIEHLCSRADASTFVLGSHSKKRPHNIIFGRTYDFQLLDMIEIGIIDYKGLQDFKGPAPQAGNKPCFVFAGHDFESRTEYGTLKSMLLDIFRGQNINAINLKVNICLANKKAGSLAIPSTTRTRAPCRSRRNTWIRQPTGHPLMFCFPRAGSGPFDLRDCFRGHGPSAPVHDSDEEIRHEGSQS